MTTENKAAFNSKIQMRKILVPIDGSECSLNAAKYAIKVAKDENAELFCIHVIAGVPYGYASSPPAIDQYFKDIEEKAQSWFDKVRCMAKTELKTETFTDVNNDRGKTDPNWAFNRIMGFLQFQKERVEKREITGATLRNFVKAIKLFCEMSDIPPPPVIFGS
jgi:hypothetical protein